MSHTIPSPYETLPKWGVNCLQVFQDCPFLDSVYDQQLYVATTEEMIKSLWTLHDNWWDESTVHDARLQIEYAWRARLIQRTNATPGGQLRLTGDSWITAKDVEQALKDSQDETFVIDRTIKLTYKKPTARPIDPTDQETALQQRPLAQISGGNYAYEPHGPMPSYQGVLQFSQHLSLPLARRYAVYINVKLERISACSSHSLTTKFSGCTASSSFK